MNNIVIVLLSCSLLLFSNGCVNTNATQGVDKVSVQDVGKFVGVVPDSEFNLDDKSGIPSKGLIIDEKLALEIGNAVIKSVYNENVIEQTEFIVCELKDKDIFVVSRIPKGGETLGGDYNVAISKIDGKILKVWAGE